ncbi:MAG: bacillithiol system redox-active protein YtxJ [Bacteroidia bacterium]|nr:bacillithiol system redox-active protein YtxJ [Bacteroidia bacterium]
MWNYTQKVDADLLLKSTTTTVIFKHSNRCSISSMALQRVLGQQNDIDNKANVLLIDVVANRQTSQLLADELNVEHASPQVIILKEGKVVHTSSHMNIRSATILSHL